MIEADSVCTGGSTTTASACTVCADPTSPDPAGTACVVQCGDGKKDGTELCEDGNILNGDGCDSTCNLEADSFCTGGTVSTPDTCTICGNGQSLNGAGTACVTVCGDGRKHSSEECEDGNTVAGDGCDATCAIEANFICSGGHITAPDTCEGCESGMTPNQDSSACVVECGDGLRHPAEE